MAKYRFEKFAINCTEKKIPTKEDYATYIGLEHMDTKNIHIARWGSDVPIIGEKLVMHKGDILFGKRNTYLRRAAIAPHDGIFSAHGMILKPKEDIVDYDFFALFIASDYFFDKAIQISVGSLSPTVNWKDLKDLEFDLPDIKTQKELAKVLWSINDTLDSYKEQLRLCDELVKAQFVEIFGTLGFDEKKWGLKKLSECCELNPKKPKDIDDNIEITFLPMPAVSEEGEIDRSIIKKYTEVKKGFTNFAERDVLFAKITPCMENGKGAVATKLSNGYGAGSTEFHVLRPINSISNPYWLYVLTTFKSFRLAAKKVMTGTGGQLRVPISFLENYIVSLPPIELQNQFEKFYKDLDKSKVVLKKCINKLIYRSKFYGK